MKKHKKIEERIHPHNYYVLVKDNLGHIGLVPDLHSKEHFYQEYDFYIKKGIFEILYESPHKKEFINYLHHLKNEDENGNVDLDKNGIEKILESF